MTYEAILERCLNQVPIDVDKREGSVIYTALAPLCLELATAYQEVRNMLDLSYLETAYESYLDKVCAPFGVIRKAAQKCIKKAEIVTEQDIIGEKFSLGDYIFIVTEEISDDTYLLEANEFSEDYNTVFGDITSVLNISGITSAEITENYNLACAAESDESLRERAILYVNYKPFSGNIADYTEKATRIAGVSYVKVFSSNDAGENNVELVLLNSDMSNVSQDVLDNADLIFNGDDDTIGIAPIGHSVSVSTCDMKDVEIKATVSTNSDLETVRLSASQRITNYITNLDINTAKISLSKILSYILIDDDILDVSQVLINDQDEDLILSKTYDLFEMPNLTDIIITKE